MEIWMPNLKLAFVGAGSIRCAAPVIATLATYFGERPMDVWLYDADEERLDLFDRFARTAFTLTESTHGLRATNILEEALQDATGVLVGFDENCARKELGSIARRMTAGESMAKMAGRIVALSPPECPILCLANSAPLEGASTAGDWPEVPDQPTYVVPLQILRWLNGEEYPYDLFRAHERSPLRSWLDNPEPRTSLLEEKLDGDQH